MFALNFVENDSGKNDASGNSIKIVNYVIIDKLW